MANQFLIYATISFILLVPIAAGLVITEKSDVEALEDLYASLNRSQHLQQWKSSGGNPCGESWRGIKCRGSSVIGIRLPGLGLTGTLGTRLFKFRSLQWLDLSWNNMTGTIPANLPLNVSIMRLSFNKFSGVLPASFRSLKNLRDLYIDNNEFIGSVSVLANLTKLQALNIENNQFNGTIPVEFRTISTINFEGNHFENGA